MRKTLPFIALAALLTLTACGYSMGESNYSVLDTKYHTLAISGVTNPTTQTWLEPRVRKLLKDELTNRGTIEWTDDTSKADALISIDIEKYYRPTAVEGASDETLRSNANFKFSAIIRSATDDAVLWRSGRISQSWPFFTGEESAADAEVTRLGIQQLADRMSENY